jgi:ribosome-binding protein aMBF1 (putative translation factor)
MRGETSILSKTITTQIKFALRNADKPQKNLARVLKVSENTISNYMNLVSPIPTKYLEKLEDYLQVKLKVYES